MGRVVQQLIPTIFYDDVNKGLNLFVGCLGHRDGDLAVVERDGAKTYWVESAEYAAKDRPEIAIETDTIYDLYAKIQARRPEMLHPNLNSVRRQPWGRWNLPYSTKPRSALFFDNGREGASSSQGGLKGPFPLSWC